MKNFYTLMAFILTLTIFSTSFAANWIPIIEGEYYVDKDSIKRDTTYSSNGFRADIKIIISIGANKGDYEFWTHYYKKSGNTYYYSPQFLAHYNRNGKKETDHFSLPTEMSWYEVKGLEAKICNYVIKNLR